MYTARFGDLGLEKNQDVGNRASMHQNGLHSNRQRGISWDNIGADAVVISGGYRDDKDEGNYILYTGEGGQDEKGRQVSDQSEDSTGNRMLKQSWIKNYPIRVFSLVPGSSPASYRFRGMYLIMDVTKGPSGETGPLVYKFHLENQDANIQHLDKNDELRISDSESFADKPMLLADDFTGACIGIAYTSGREDVAAYDYDKFVQILCKVQGMTEEDALEYMEYNVLGAYVGDKTPTFVKFSDTSP